MVDWPWSHKQERAKLSAAAVTGYRQEAQSQVSPTMVYTPRLPHPLNIDKYTKWATDPEAGIALKVLTDNIAGVDFYTEMPKKDDQGNKIDPEHENKHKIDEFCKNINLSEDLQQITYTMLAKGFCPVERLPNYDLKILPPETFYIYRDVYGKILKYTQEYMPNQVIATWEGSQLEDIILFKYEEDTSHPYGISLLESIGPLLDIRNQMNEDIGKVLHRMGYPIPVMHTSQDKTALDKAIQDRDPDQWITVGNVLKDEFGFEVIEIASRSQPHEWIDLINMLICEGLHAPLLLYLKNATEASATVMMESVDRSINGTQRYIKKRVEEYLFKPQISGPVPELTWGQPKTGLEKVTLTELASIINSPKLTFTQSQALLKQFFPNMPEPTPQEIDKVMNPQPIFAPKQDDGKEKPQLEPQKMHQLELCLQVVKENFEAHKITITEAIREGDRAITTYINKAKQETMQKISDTFNKPVERLSVESERYFALIRNELFDSFRDALLPMGVKGESNREPNSFTVTPNY